jgi:threonine synthase
MTEAGPYPSWLLTPHGAVWPDPSDTDLNSFVRYRRLLWSWHKAMASGWSDHDFVDTVRSLDASVADVDGRGFTRTPARWNERLAGDGATSRVFAKDETHNVGGSHKARHLMGLLLHLAVDASVTDTRLAISSCGNAAIGAATVARAANRPIDVFIPTWADASVVEVLQRLDATIHVCERRAGEIGDPCMLRFSEAVQNGALAFGVQATENRWTLDGGRTLGWELADQFADDVPDHVFVQVGGGALLASTAMGLLEAVETDRIPSSPKVWAVQAEGCAPFDRAWRRIGTTGPTDHRLSRAEAAGADLMTPWTDPMSAATGILDDVTYDWLGVSRALLETSGDSVVVPELDIVAANDVVGGAGYDSDETGSAGYAGLRVAVTRGLIEHEETAGVLITGIRR